MDRRVADFDELENGGASILRSRATAKDENPTLPKQIHLLLGLNMPAAYQQQKKLIRKARTRFTYE
jgi:hypothetical protein